MILRGSRLRRPRAGLLAAAVTAAVLLANASAASAAGVSGYQVVQGSATNITPGQTVTAAVSCAAGQDVLSGGVSAHSPMAFIQSSYPTSSSTWSVTMTDTGIESYTEHFTPYAVCVNASSVPGIHQAENAGVVVGPDTYYGEDNAAADAYCNSGEVVVGGGVHNADAHTFLTISHPTDDEQAWDVFVHLTVPADAPSTFDVYSVCIPSADVSSYSIQTSNYGDYGTLLGTDAGGTLTGVGPDVANTAGTPYCPSGTVAAAGGETNNDHQNEFLSTLYPAPGDSHYWIVTQTDVNPPTGYDENFVPQDICVTQQLLPTKLVAYPQLVELEPFVGVGSQTVEATLTSGGIPVSGQTVYFTSGSTALCRATTNAAGVARCYISASSQSLLYRTNHYTAAFNGTGDYTGSTSTTLVVTFIL